MEPKKFLTALRRTLFLLLTALILVRISHILVQKTVYGTQNDTILLKVGNFWDEPEDSYDVLAFGSSHMYCTLNPACLYEQTGLRSYVLATQQQPPIITYYYVREALKTQHPDVVIVEGNRFTHEDTPVNSGVAHDALAPYPMSLNKLQMIMQMRHEGSKEQYFVNLMLFHTRWKYLTEADFTFELRNKNDPLRGYMFFPQVGESSSCQQSYDALPLPVAQAHLDYLLKIQALTEEHGAKMVLLFAPFPMDDTSRGKLLTLHQFAQEHGIEVLDMNLEFDAIGLNGATDYCDSSHLNINGAEKATSRIGTYLLENCGLSPRPTDELEWLVSIQVYQAKKAE